MKEIKSGEAQATAGYVMELYMSIERLNDAIASYIDFLVNLNSKYEENPEAKMAENEQQLLRDLVYSIRREIFKIDVKLRALSSKIETIKITKELKDMTKKLIEKPVYDIKDLQEYAYKANEVFVAGVGYDVLEKLSDIYGAYLSAFGGGGNEAET